MILPRRLTYTMGQRALHAAPLWLRLDVAALIVNQTTNSVQTWIDEGCLRACVQGVHYFVWTQDVEYLHALRVPDGPSFATPRPLVERGLAPMTYKGCTGVLIVKQLIQDEYADQDYPSPDNFNAWYALPEEFYREGDTQDPLQELAELRYKVGQIESLLENVLAAHRIGEVALSMSDAQKEQFLASLYTALCTEDLSNHQACTWVKRLAKLEAGHVNDLTNWLEQNPGSIPSEEFAFSLIHRFALRCERILSQNPCARIQNSAAWGDLLLAQNTLARIGGYCRAAAGAKLFLNGVCKVGGLSPTMNGLLRRHLLRNGVTSTALL